MGNHWRPAWADIDLDAVRHNAGVLVGLAAPAALCAVVKADAYGHGSLPVARAAVEGGASWLAVALVEEGIRLREAGIDVPILLLSEVPADAVGEAVARGLTPTVYTAPGIAAVARAAAARPRAPGRIPGHIEPVAVHLKVDTGMHRVGADSGEVPSLARAVVDDPGLRLGAIWTHLAVADGATEEDQAFTRGQVARFDAAVAAAASAGAVPEMIHVANSAATIGHASARRDLVRCGLALYGVAPTPELGDRVVREGGAPLRPALSLRTRVSFVRDLAAGERPSYGRRRPLPVDSTVATAPIGYADGVPRRLFDAGAEVLVRGRRRPLAGVVTMDQVVIDCGPAGEAGVEVGDEVVLLGRQGDEEVTADEWAGLLGTISYEVLCDIGPRVPRVAVSGPSHRGGAA